MAGEPLTPDELATLQSWIAPAAPPAARAAGISQAGGNANARAMPLDEGAQGSRGWVDDLSDWYGTATAGIPKDPAIAEVTRKLRARDETPQAATAGGIDPALEAQYLQQQQIQQAPPAPMPPPAPPPPQASPTPQQLASIGLGGGTGAAGGAGASFDPETEAALKKYAELEQGAAESGAEGKETEHEALKKAASDTAQYEVGERGMAEGKRLERQARLDEAEGHWKAAQEDAAKARLEDPRSHLGWGQRLAMAVSLAAGAFGAGLTHQENGAAKLWDSYLNDDIARQREAIGAGKAKVEDLHSVYAQQLRRTGDEEKAEILARAAGHQAFVSGLQQELLTAQDPSVRAAGLKELADAQRSIAEEREKYDKLKPKPKAAGGGGGAAETEKELRHRIQDLRDKAAANGVDLDPAEARRQALLEAGALSGGPRAQGYAKPPREGGPIDPRAELHAAVSDIDEGYGEDLYDRNAPAPLRSSEALVSHQKLAVAARAALKVIGGREPPAGREGDDHAIATMVGPRPDANAVKAFVARAEHLTGRPAGANPPGTPASFKQAGQ